MVAKSVLKTCQKHQMRENKSPISRHRRLFAAKCTSQVANLATSRLVWQPWLAAVRAGVRDFGDRTGARVGWGGMGIVGLFNASI